MQNWLSRVKAVTTSTGPGDLVIGAALDGTWRTFASALDGEIVDVLVEHESLAEKEVGAYRYDHATTTLQRASTGAVEWSTAGAATKATFSAGNKHVSIDVNAGSLRGFALYRGSGRTLVEDTDWTAGGTFSVSLTNPTHRSVVVSGVASGALAQAMTVALPAASGGEWGDEVYVEKAATAGAPTVTVTGPAAPLALKAPGDWLVAKIVGTTAKAWAVRARGNAEMAEDTVAGALTVDGRLIDRMQLYTGAGHTWTINTAARAGVVPVANEGSGPITVTAGTATLSGDPEIPAGSKGMVVYTQAGAQARVLSELMRATTGSSAGTPFTTSVPFSIRKVLASTGPIPASAFGIWPDSGADETTRIGTALTALAGEGPNPVTGRKRSLGFVNGTYLVSNLADATTVKCVGENGTVFQYNGAAGAGTFIWKITIAGGDPRVTYGKFRGVKLNGTAPGGAMAEAGLWFATAPDWSTLLDTCHFFGIGLYAVRLAGATNFYAYDCRCDAVGASMFRVEGEPTRQNLIAVIRGTCTWNDPGNLVNWVNQGYIAAGAVGGVAAYWGRSVVELLHTGGAGGGSFVALRDYNVEWHFAGDPAGSGIVLDRNASTNVNRPNRLLIQNIRGFTDDTHQIVGFTGTDNRQPIVTAHQASQDGGGARPVFDFTRSLAFGNAFSTSFKWAGAGRFFAENGGPMLGTAAARPAANTWLRGERYFATDTGLESLCDGTAWIDSSAGTGVPTYQAVTASAAQAGYQITRTSAHIRVELTEDLTATGTFALPTSPIDGDVVTVVRNSGGFFDWTNAATSTVLGYREDLAVFQRASGAWKRISLRGRAGARRESAGRDLLLADHSATIAVTATATYNLPAAAGTSTGFRVTLEQRGSGYVTLTIDTGGGLTQVGSSILQTTYDGDALVIEALGSSQVKVSHRPVETAALATAATSLTSSGTAGRPRRSTATGPVTFTLDNTAPIGASGTLIKGPQDITVTCAANVEYAQSGVDLGATNSTADFECQGVMGWEVVAIVGSVRKYLITGELSLPLAAPINLGSGDVEGILTEDKGGTGTSSLATAAAVANKLPLAGGTMAGAINMGTFNLTNIGRLVATTSVPRHVTQALPYTLAATDNGIIISFTNAGTLTVPIANVLAPNAGEGFAILLVATGGDVVVDGPGTPTITVRNNYYGTVTARNGGGNPRAAEGAQSTAV